VLTTFPFCVPQGDKLVGTGAVGQAQQGSSVSLSADGNTALVGGPNDIGPNDVAAGAAWVYTRSNGAGNAAAGQR
jgi:hypothetical protein